MAKKVQTKSTEEILWDAANKLRGSIEPSEYKHVVLSLIFLKFASDKFIKRREELIAEVTIRRPSSENKRNSIKSLKRRL